MKNAAIIFCFTVLVTLFYRYVGQLVPQKEVPAPKEVSVSADMSTAEMIEVGKTLVDSRCMSCHAIQPRFPELKGIGARAGTRKAGMNDIDYLAETLYEPNAFIVEPFAAGMTPANKPPLNLTDQEILTVIAYLQSLGGTATVTMKTKLKYATEVTAASGSGPAPQGAAPATAQELLAKYACLGCHSLDQPTPLVGPSLYDVGKRMNKAQIFEALLEPDATVATGFAPGVMSATLQGTGFYKQVTSEQLKTLVDHLSSLKGGNRSPG